MCVCVCVRQPPIKEGRRKETGKKAKRESEQKLEAAGYCVGETGKGAISSSGLGTGINSSGAHAHRCMLHSQPMALLAAHMQTRSSPSSTKPPLSQL